MARTFLRRLKPAAVVAGGLLGLLVTLPAAARAEEPPYAPDQIIVTVKPEAPCAACVLRMHAHAGTGSIQQLAGEVQSLGSVLEHAQAVRPLFRKEEAHIASASRAASITGAARLLDEFVSQTQAVKARFPERAARAPIMDAAQAIHDAEIMMHTYVVQLKDLTVPEAVALFSKHPLVAHATPDYRMQLYEWTDPPNDSRFNELWGMAAIKARPAWLRARGLQPPDGKPVVVAIVDTGIDYNHEDLRDRMWRNPGEIPGNGIDDDGNGKADDVYGYDFGDRDADPHDDGASCCGRHGTHVAGTVAATGNNGVGVIGVAPEAQLMAVKAFPSNREGASSSDLIDAMNYAVANGADVMNNSWGCGRSACGVTQYGPNYCLDGADGYYKEPAVRYAVSAGVVVVFAAGNGFDDNCDRRGDRPDDTAFISPQRMAEPIVVCASTPDGSAAYFSNQGASVDVCAPGTSVLSSVPGGYASFNGTSMASPHVAGLAALVLSANPNLNVTQVEARITSTADGGRINADRAVQPAANRPPVLDPIGPKSVTRPAMLEFTYTASDPDQNALTFQLTGLPAGATLEALSPTSGRFRWTPSANQVGPHVVTCKVSDGQAEDTEAVTITVEPAQVVNQPPVLDPIGPKNATVGQALQFTVTGSDPNAGQSLTFSAAPLPTGATFNAPRQFQWQPAANQIGNHQIVFKVSDGQAEDTETVTVAVTNPIGPTSYTLTASPTTVQAGGQLTVTWTAPTGQTSLYDWIGLFPQTGQSTDFSLGWRYARKATSGSVTMTAPSQAGSYEFRYLRRNGFTDVAKSQAITVQGVSTNKPDLMVTNVTSTPIASQIQVGTVVTIEATIRNASITTQAPASLCALTIDGLPLGQPLPVSALAPGAQQTVTATWTATAGAHPIVATADPANAISEDNEANNTLNWTLNVGDGTTNKPDLTVTELTVSPSTIQAGATMTFQATIRNVGAAQAAASFCRFTLDDTQIAQPTVTTLAVNGQATVTATWTATADAHAIVAAVDPTNAIVESNESNNTMQRSFAVGGQPADLILESINHPAVIRAGDSVSFTLNIKNQGGGASAASSGELLIDGVRHGVIAVEALQPGGRATVTLAPWAATAGPHTLEGRADSAGAVQESNENNNSRTQTITVETVSTTPLSVTPAQAAPGAPLTVAWNVPPAQVTSSDWVGLYLISETNNQRHLAWRYTNGQGIGSTAFFTAPQEAGTYHFRYFKDNGYEELTLNGQPVRSGTLTVSAGADTTSPTVTLTQPALNAVLHETTTVKATATDGVGVTKVEFYANTAKIGEDAGSPYEFAWDISNVADGPKSLQAKAYDAAGNVGSSVVVPIAIQHRPVGERVIRVKETSIAPGATAQVPIELDARGDENGISFTLEFDPAILSQPQVTVGSGASGATITTVTTQLAQGRLGVLFILPTNQTLSSGTRELMKVAWHVAAGATGNTIVGFGNAPTLRQVTDVNAATLSATYAPGVLRTTPTQQQAGWSRISVGTTQDLADVDLAGATGWAVGRNRTILKTTDGGRTWGAVSLGSFTTTSSVELNAHVLNEPWPAYGEHHFLAVDAVDADIVWMTTKGAVSAPTGSAVGANNLSAAFLSTNGGTSWKRLVMASNFQLSGIAAFDNTRALIVTTGGDGHPDGDSLTIAPVANGPSHTKLNRALFGFNDLAMVSPALGIGVGGEIKKTADAGVAWTAMSAPEGPYRAVTMVDGNMGWAVGDNGQIARTTNGSTWVAQTSGTDRKLLGVSFIDAQHGWAVGQGGTILHTDNGGTTWSAEPSGTGQDLYSVKALSAVNAIAVGKSGTVVRRGEQ